MLFVVAYTLLNYSYHALKLTLHVVIGIGINFSVKSCKQTIFLFAPLGYETVDSLQRWELFDLLE